MFDCLKGGVTRAYGHAGQSAVTGFWTVLTGLIPPEDRPLIEALQREGPPEQQAGPAERSAA